MRTRIRTGLGQLREKLDRKFGGRESWCLLMVPLAVAEKDSDRPGAPASLATNLGGSIVRAMLKAEIWGAAVSFIKFDALRDPAAIVQHGMRTILAFLRPSSRIRGEHVPGADPASA